MTTRTESLINALTVRIERLYNQGQFYGVTEADYVDLTTIVAAVAGVTAVPKREITERVSRLLEHTFPPSIFLVARETDDILGFVIAEVGNTANTEHVGWLRMDVHPNFQNQGVGSLLLDEMLTHARNEGLKRLEITSYEPNLRARRFFQNHGFKTEGKHLYARRDPETGKYIDTYTLAKILKS